MAEKQSHKATVTRRGFIGRTASAAVAAGFGASIARSAHSANETLGIGVIGCGGRSRSHLKTWTNVGKQKNAKVVAVCDVYKPRLQDAADKYDAKGYEDYRELLADPNVDLVSIATPDHWHGRQAIDAMKAGKDVYCEKPMTHWSQFEVAKEVAKVAKETGRVFLLGTQGMSDGAWWQMRKLIDDGLLGHPLHAECGYFRVGDWGERKMWMDPNAREGKDVNWELFLGDRPKRDYSPSRFFRWRMYEDYAGGPSTDLFPHSFTPVTTMLDLKAPACAVATGGIYRYPLSETQKEDPNETIEREVPDTFNMLVDYPGGITCAILGTQGNATQNLGPSRGAGGRLPVLRGWEGTLTIQGNEIVYDPAGTCKKKPQRFPIESGENMGEYFMHLLDKVRAGDPETKSPAERAYHTQTALIMGYLALREGKTMRFDAQQEQIIS